MRALLIAYSFPPFHDAQSIRWYYLANGLAELGLELDVLTVRHPQSDSPLWRFHPNLRILRTFPGPMEAVSLKMKNRLGVDESGNRELRRTGRFKLMKSAYWAVRKLAGGVLPGDIRTEWFPFALKAIGGALSEGRYACMITSHEPWVDSLLGLYLKKKHRGLRWVADFGDPYVAPYTPGHKLWFERRLEHSIYESADALIFTNDNVLEHLKGKYPSLKEKQTAVIGQGFSPGEFEDASAGRGRGKKVFTMLYTGTFYSGMRDPEALIEALCLIDFPFSFRLAGKNESFVEGFRALGSSFEYLGFIDHFRALKLQRESDVLVHMGNNNPLQVPGKVFEYLGAMRPILSINSDLRDPTGKLVTDLKRGLSCGNDAISIKEAIGALHAAWQEGNVRFDLTSDGIQEYSWNEKAKTIYDMIRAGE